jgi:hypothetical protein
MPGFENSPIYLEMLNKFGETFEKTSEDVNMAGTNRYMTGCQERVVNFDNFKSDFVKTLKLSETPLSCDVFYAASTGELFLIEFKNGKIDALKNYEIKVKIFESLLILSEKISKTIDFTRGNLNFILVYNESIPHGFDQFNNTGKKSIQDKLSKLGKLRYVRFGLQRFEKLYFKDVYTYTKMEFESEFVSRYCKAKAG